MRPSVRCWKVEVLLILLMLLSCASFRSPFLQSPRRQSTCIEALRPLSKQAVDKLVPYVATPEQLAWYSGRDATEVYEQALETTMVAFIGAWGSYFASFFIGSPLAVVTGTAFAANGLIKPFVSAYQRAVAVRGDEEMDPMSPVVEEMVRTQNVAALFAGTVESCVLVDRRGSPIRRVARRAGKRNGGDLRYDEEDDGSVWAGPREGRENEGQRLLVTVVDEAARRLSLEAVPFEDQLRNLAPGQLCQTIVFSPVESGFQELYSTTDVYVEAVDAWIGPYPYLDRSEFKHFLDFLDSQRDLREKEGYTTKSKRAVPLNIRSRSSSSGGGFIGEDKPRRRVRDEENDNEATPQRRRRRRPLLKYIYK